MAVGMITALNDVSRQEDCSQIGQGNFAPACAVSALGFYDCPRPFDALRPEISTQASERYAASQSSARGNASQRSSSDGCDGISASFGSGQSGADCSDPAAVAAQQQLDQMSQMVMEIWAKLRAVEASMETPPLEASSWPPAADSMPEHGLVTVT